jgi:hypothetical protein
MEKLNWYSVKGYEGLYEITKCGKVKALAKTRIGIYKRNYKEKNMSIVKIGDGYFSVTLHKDGIKKKWLLHRLVASCFLEKIEGKEYVNHKDKDKKNNHVDNLEWVSSIENNCHMQIGRTNQSKYPGVYLSKCKKKYLSQINYIGVRYFLGSYKTEIEAYNARCKYEKDNGIINKYL